MIINLKGEFIYASLKRDLLKNKVYGQVTMLNDMFFSGRFKLLGLRFYNPGAMLHFQLENGFTYSYEMLEFHNVDYAVINKECRQELDHLKGRKLPIMFDNAQYFIIESEPCVVMSYEFEWVDDRVIIDIGGEDLILF